MGITENLRFSFLVISNHLGDKLLCSPNLVAVGTSVVYETRVSRKSRTAYLVEGPISPKLWLSTISSKIQTIAKKLRILDSPCNISVV